MYSRPYGGPKGWAFYYERGNHVERASGCIGFRGAGNSRLEMGFEHVNVQVSTEESGEESGEGARFFKIHFQFRHPIFGNWSQGELGGGGCNCGVCNTRVSVCGGK